jgi:hypothetical protein
MQIDENAQTSLIATFPFFGLPFMPIPEDLETFSATTENGLRISGRTIAMGVHCGRLGRCSGFREMLD